MTNFIKKSKYFLHETKRHALLKFLAIVFVFIAYLLWLIFHFGAKSGIETAGLTWSFFVLCTPIADAGFLLDFPIRIISGIKMILSETIVWIIAISLNLYFFFTSPEVYQKTIALKLFRHILEQPFPFWGIIFLSLLGTFLSVYFGDELIDSIKHSDREKHKKHKLKHRFIIFLFFIGTVFIFYNFALKQLGINLNL